MNHADHDFKKALDEWAEDQNQNELSDAEIEALRSGSLTEDARLDLLERFALSDQDPELLLEETESDSVPPEQVEASLQALKRKAAEDDAPQNEVERASITTPVVQFPTESRQERPPKKRLNYLAIVAMFFMFTTLGLLVRDAIRDPQGAGLIRGANDHSRPVFTTDVAIIDVYLDGNVRGAQEVNATASNVMVKFHLPRDSPRYDQYELVIEQSGSEPITETLTPIYDKTLALSIWNNPPIDRTVRIFGLSGGERIHIADQFLDLTNP